MNTLCVNKPQANYIALVLGLYYDQYHAQNASGAHDGDLACLVIGPLQEPNMFIIIM